MRWYPTVIPIAVRTYKDTRRMMSEGKTYCCHRRKITASTPTSGRVTRKIIRMRCTLSDIAATVYLKLQACFCPLSQSLCECPDVSRGNLHSAICARHGVIHPLHLNVGEKAPLCGTQRVAAVIATRGFFAGFDASEGHWAHEYYVFCILVQVSYLTPPFIIAMLVALTVHEWAHGYTAYLLGDSTAKY